MTFLLSFLYTVGFVIIVGIVGALLNGVTGDPNSIGAVVGFILLFVLVHLIRV